MSHSQVATYLLCSERFRLQYVMGARPSHRSGELVFGTAVHGALALYHEHLRSHDESPEVALILERFDEVFASESDGPTPVLWQDAGSPDTLRAIGVQLLSLYCETVRPTRVIAVEKPFRVSQHELPAAFQFEESLVGVIDLIEEDADGIQVITEIKTSGRKFDDNRLQFDLQVALYAAVRKALGCPGARLRFRVLLRTKQPSIQTYELRRDDTQLAEAGRIVTQVLRAIDHGIFYPARGWACTSCPFRSECGS